MEPLAALSAASEVPRPLAEVAAAQHGLVTRAQLAAAGVEITKGVRAGRLHRIRPSVYALGHTVLTANGRRMAAVLACGAGAVLSHGSAAVLLGLRQSSARVHVTVGRHGPHSRGGLVVHRVRRLAPEDVTVVDGIPVTTWARTALDIAETQRVEGLLEQAEILRVFDLHELRAVMARNPGRRGLKRLAAALDRLEDAPAIPKTVLERRFLALCRRLGLDEPEQQVLVGPHRVDFLWRAAGLVVEADSRTFHEIRAAFERDRGRDVDLAALGLQVLRVTSRQLDRPSAALVATLTARARTASR